MILDESSLANTIDNLNDAWFYSRPIATDERKEIALWLAGRQGLKGSYHGMFAPTLKDFADPIRLFSGDAVKSSGSKAHVLGEETLRALIKLDVKNDKVAKAFKLGFDAMNGVIQRDEKKRNVEHQGYFCCPTCTSAYWRAMTVNALSKSKERLSAGMNILKHSRSGTGRWNRYPFFYTLLVLSEMDTDLAGDELEYASTATERFLKRRPTDDPYYQRRRDIAERAIRPK